ncbi:hypothetical protein M422DRAFT_263536 [Sphaerobolus stellatus SS14]|uniref:C2H2-type domain-containing protein n=1 Tax=Sphaerobolus stellatus (strain SS14) TaxID=990650 RepID=A0A0C9UHS7_SPHS4|nr:hypothetical protein M422DRAFT_263536 [Sphaerobolus stellatus SS14]
MASYSDDHTEPMPHAQYTQTPVQGFYSQGVDSAAQYLRRQENNGYTAQRQPQYQGASTVQQMHLPQAYAGQISLPGPSSSQVKVVNGHQLKLLTQEEKAREGKDAVCLTCVKYLSTIYNAERHAEKYSEKKYKCDYCQQKYSRKDYRDSHVAERKCTQSKRALGDWQAGQQYTGYQQWQ